MILGKWQKRATPIGMRTLTVQLKWFQMLSKDLLRAGPEITVSPCGEELDFHFVNFMMLYGRLIRKAEK